jgi:Protein of unknown function (DUF2911)/Tetratricopeptide repeat
LPSKNYKIMKRILLAMAMGAVVFTASAQQLRTPAPSPTQTIKQDFGLSAIELSYSRPGVKGRKIFGDVRPYGVIWRTGANGATTLTFGDDVTIGGTMIKAGKYGLLSIPDKNNWIIIITKQLDVTSPDAYKQDQDVVRVNVKPMMIKEPMETFTIQFANVKPNSCDLQLLWENTGITLPITTNVDAKVMSQLNTLIAKDSIPYFAAASYYLDNNKDLNKAKEWAQKAADMNPKAFFIFHLLAKIQVKLGEKANAIATANKSIELAKEAKNNDYVLLNEKLIASLK